MTLLPVNMTSGKITPESLKKSMSCSIFEIFTHLVEREKGMRRFP